MAKPANSISTVKLPGDTNARPIVPYYVGYNSSNNYVATLPQLTSDAQILTTKEFQVIQSYKMIQNAGLGFSTSSSYGDGNISYHTGGANGSTESLRFFYHDPACTYNMDIGNRGLSFDIGSTTMNIFHVDDEYLYTNSDAIYFGGQRDSYGWETNVKTLLFPTMNDGDTKTIATTDQIQNIPIDDLTNLVS